MGSTGVLLRDVAERQDDVVDPVTLRLSSPPGDAVVVYEGPCWVFPAPDEGSWGGGRGDEERPAHLIHIPYDAAVPRPGDRFRITSCPDASLVDVAGSYLLKVQEVSRSEFLVTRMFTVVRVGGPVPAT